MSKTQTKSEIFAEMFGTPPPATYAQEREKFLEGHSPRGNVWAFAEWLDKNAPLDALFIAAELHRLTLLRANESALARTEILAAGEGEK